MTATRWWCEHAWLGDDTTVDAVTIEADAGIITAVRSGDTVPTGDAVILRGLTLPGLANSHSHAFHRALRGRTHHDPTRPGHAMVGPGHDMGGPGNFWTWREQMYRLAGSLTPDSYHRLARAVYAEMALAGITTVGEFHYLHHGVDGRPYADRGVMTAALVAAAADAGLRLTLLDTCYLAGGIGIAPDAVQRRFSDGGVEEWQARTSAVATRHAAPHVRFAHAIHSVRAVPADAIATIAQWSQHTGSVLHAHVSEQPLENEQCVAAYGCTPTELLRRNDALTSLFTAVHATHLTDSDITAVGSAGCTVCMCPTTERDLADGIGPAARLVAAGAALSVGSDSHAVIDLLEEARGIELDERLASGQRGRHSSVDLLRAATSGGCDSLGWAGGGRLAVGAPCDLVTVRLDSPRTAGADPHRLLDAAVFAATAADVAHVVVGGRAVVTDGAHTTIDVAAELQRAIASVWEAA